MKLFKEIAFASALSLAALFNAAPGEAHEIKAGALVIHHPWSRQSPMHADVAAGFMTITNTGSAGDRLLGATAEISPKVQIHDMKMMGDVVKMVEIPEGIAIPAGATVELKPRSLHIMFLDVTHTPSEGEQFKGTLTFEKAGTVDVEFEVAAPGAGMN